MSLPDTTSYYTAGAAPVRCAAGGVLCSQVQVRPGRDRSDPFCTPALPACARDESLGSEPTFNARRRFARGDMGGLLGRTLMVRDQDDPHSPGLGVQAQSFKPAPVSRCHTQSFGGSSFAFASRPSRAQNEQPSERTRQFRPGRLLALRSPRGNGKQAMASSGAGQSAQGASDLL